MIPASYLFKDVFHQTFYDPDIAAAVERHHDHPGPGLLARFRRHHYRPAAAPTGLPVRTV
jgi:hypothetical protein